MSRLESISMSWNCTRVDRKPPFRAPDVTMRIPRNMNNEERGKDIAPLPVPPSNDLPISLSYQFPSNNFLSICRNPFIRNNLIHSFKMLTEYIWNFYYVPSTVLGIEDTAVKRQTRPLLLNKGGRE